MNRRWIVILFAALVCASCQSGSTTQQAATQQPAPQAAPAASAVKINRAFVLDVVDSETPGEHLFANGSRTPKITLAVSLSDSGPVYTWKDSAGKTLVDEKVKFKYGQQGIVTIQLQDNTPGKNLSIRDLYWKRHPSWTQPLNKAWKKDYALNGKIIKIKDVGAPLGHWSFGLILFDGVDFYGADPTIVDDPIGIP